MKSGTGEVVIGIDYGNTYSSIAYYKESNSNNNVVITKFDGLYETPSYVCFNKSGEEIVVDIQQLKQLVHELK